jgi:hypothetical protein
MHDLGRECYDDQCNPESRIFSFKLILYELAAREPAFPTDLKQSAVAKRLVVDKDQPIIAAFVLPAVQKLIRKD